jgi:hypothetical protein
MEESNIGAILHMDWQNLSPMQISCIVYHTYNTGNEEIRRQLMSRLV